MYHVTETHCIEPIMNEGLMPRIGERSDALGEPVARVYLFSCIEAVNDALLNWLGEWFEDKSEETGEPVDLSILEIDVSDLTVTPTFDGGDSWEYYSEAPIPPTAITKVMREAEFGELAY